MNQRTDTIRLAGPSDTDAIKAMGYPVATVDGQVMDLAIPIRAIDPLYDDCPAWCVEAKTGHDVVEDHDTDRRHYGKRYGVIVRSIEGDRLTASPNGEDEEDRVILGAAQVYLQRSAREHQGQIWLGKGEDGDGFELSLDEAEEIAELLTVLAAEGRGSR